VSPIAAATDGYEAPSVSDFWQPLFGTEGPFAITRPALIFLLSAIVLSVVLLRATRKLTVVPGKGQWVTESVYGLVRNSVARDIIGSREFLVYVPFLFSLFTLILVNNLFGVIPFIQYPPAARIGLPIALTLFVYVLFHWIGFRRMGFVGYFKHMVPPGLPPGLREFVFLLELVTYFFTRPVTLALRLFGNMFAGHLLILLCVTGGEYLLFESDKPGFWLAGVATFFGGFLMTIFEILVEFLQAYIFTLLSALYIAGALADEH
jgi:F-type H+-transporting ATPase subunit a